MKYNNESLRLSGAGMVERLSWMIGISGLGLSVAGWYFQPSQFYHSWLVAFVFWTSVALGGLFFTLLHHLTSATWSVVLRRIFETFMIILPVMVLFFLPVIAGKTALYEWSHANAVAHDHLLKIKAPFLNMPFFITRTVLYFIIWTVLAVLLYRTSLQQDSGGNSTITKRLRTTSAPGVVLFAFTTAFAAFDWLMSLDAHWYSTIFGLYYFAGSAMAIVAVVILVVNYFRGRKILNLVITEEHDHDLGKWLFTFMVFWAYMAFSQYFLIWYANIPEETVWFIHRWQGTWKIASLLLLVGHFVLPFLILMVRASKRSRFVLTGMAIWLLLMHWVDMYWLVFPTLRPHGIQLSWIDPVTMLGMGGVFMGLFFWLLKKQPIVPVGDPRLNESINMINQ